MNITIVGTGYVGLVTGACLAEFGNNVLCIDTDDKKIAALRNGNVPIYEPGLNAIVAENLQAERLQFSTDISKGVEFAEIIFIAVGTPPDEDGSADLKYILQVASSIGEEIQNYRVIVTKSTVPVGTAELVSQTIHKALKERSYETEFSVVSNPEFLKEGAAVDDFMKPDRIVIGVDDKRAEIKMRELYAPFARNHDKVMIMNIASAELTKYAANAMLATKISFMNEMSNIAERLGADIESVRRGIGSDPRIGYNFIYPGCGYGGSCFPKDVKAIVKTAADIGYPARILEAVEEVNNSQKYVIPNKIRQNLGDSLTGKKFAIWGLAFKPNTDDMRDAPSIIVINDILKRGGTIVAFDPVAHEEAARIYKGVENIKFNSEDPYDVLDDADALVLVTEWSIFRSPDYSRIRNLMKGNSIFDGRNVFDPVMTRNNGFDYYGIGR
jgi:UDPglucose 6-dehydrogenase